jgi:hypothetical protein
MTLIEMLRANGSWETDAAASKLQSQTDRIEKLEAALREIIEMDPLRPAFNCRDIARKALERNDETVG